MLPGSDFGSRASRTRTLIVSADVRSPSTGDAAVAAALAVLEVVMPHIPSAARRSSGAKIIIEVARAVHESLVHLGAEEHRATEVSRRVSVEGVRWERRSRARK
jgi:hypothetical protein